MTDRLGPDYEPCPSLIGYSGPPLRWLMGYRGGPSRFTHEGPGDDATPEPDDTDAVDVDLAELTDPDAAPDTLRTPQSGLENLQRPPQPVTEARPEPSNRGSRHVTCSVCNRVFRTYIRRQEACSLKCGMVVRARRKSQGTPGAPA